MAPIELFAHPAPTSSAYGLRLSANLNCLTVPRCRLSTYGCRAIYYAGPTVWKSLRDEIRNSDSFVRFKQFLKTVLFSCYKCDPRIRGFF